MTGVQTCALPICHGRIVSIADGRVEFQLGDEIPSEVTSSLTLLLAIFKFDRMEWSIEKCTELGVKRIIPVIARRTDAHLPSAALKRVERWRRIATHASEQSRRATTPEITSPSKLPDAVNIDADLRIVLTETETETMVREVVTSHPHNQIALAIGPEGGWTEDELDLFGKQGWISASLGPTILRAETAAIAAVAIALS